MTAPRPPRNSLPSSSARNPPAPLLVQPGRWVTDLSEHMGNTFYGFKVNASSVSIEPAQFQSPVIRLPGVFVSLVQPDRFAAEHLADVDEAAFPFDRAGIAHPPHDEAPRVMHLRGSRRVLARRGLVQIRRCALPQRFVGPLLVVLDAELLEGALLSCEARPWRLRPVALERSVHALMPAVLPGVHRSDPAGAQAQ